MVAHWRPSLSRRSSFRSLPYNPRRCSRHWISRDIPMRHPRRLFMSRLSHLTLPRFRGHPNERECSQGECFMDKASNRAKVSAACGSAARLTASRTALAWWTSNPCVIPTARDAKNVLLKFQRRVLRVSAQQTRNELRASAHLPWCTIWCPLKVGESKVRNETKGNAGAFDSPKRVEWDSKDFHAASCCIARSRAGQPEISFVQRRSRKSAQSAY